MKNLPQSISIFKINEKKQTIRYERMYQEEVRWEQEDIFKCLILIFPILSLLLFALGTEFHIFILRCSVFKVQVEGCRRNPFAAKRIEVSLAHLSFQRKVCTL